MMDNPLDLSAVEQKIVDDGIKAVYDTCIDSFVQFTKNIPDTPHANSIEQIIMIYTATKILLGSVVNCKGSKLFYIETLMETIKTAMISALLEVGNHDKD